MAVSANTLSCQGCGSGTFVQSAIVRLMSEPDAYPPKKADSRVVSYRYECSECGLEYGKPAKVRKGRAA